MWDAVESSEFEKGYLAGLVDGEGYIVTKYEKKVDRTYPGMRIYGTSKPIIDTAARIMNVNPHPRRDHGKLVGWIATASGTKAVETMCLIASGLTDPAKKCRVLTCINVFRDRVSIRGRHPSTEFFDGCPPPTRSRMEQATNGSSLQSRKSGARRTFSSQVDKKNSPGDRIPAETSVHSKGWLCGIVDGEGYVHVRYRSDRDSMYPRIRIFLKSQAIIEEAARVLGVKPYARVEHGEHRGWYVSVSHMKAMRVLRVIAPYLADPSKRCRARRILQLFAGVGTIHSRLATADFFKDCPPPSRIRKYRRIIKTRKVALSARL